MHHSAKSSFRDTCMQFTCHSIALSHSETKYFPVKLQMNKKKKKEGKTQSKQHKKKSFQVLSLVDFGSE